MIPGQVIFGKSVVSRELFKELSLPQKSVAQAQANSYRVYSTGSDFVTVEAESATEAFQKSGFTTASRIERDTLSLTNVLRMEAMKDTILIDIKDPVPGEQAAAQAEPAPAIDNSAVLSTEEVDKLLDAPAQPVAPQ